MRIIATLAAAVMLAGCAQIADGGRYIISTAADRTLIEAKCDEARAARAMALGVIGARRYPSRADTIQAAAADLAAAAALCSSLFDNPLPMRQVVFGEVALSGTIRPVNQTEARLKEAQKLGFTGALAPAPAWI